MAPDAAHELASYARGACEIDRHVLATVGLLEAGPAGEAELRSMLTDPELQLYARLWLRLPGREAS